MAVIQDPSSGTSAKVDGLQQALRVAVRPQDHGARGAYHAAFYTGAIAAGLAANSELFQFRFISGGGLLALLRSIEVSAAVSTTAFAAGVPITLEARAARSWSVQGTGGSGITFGANDAKKRVTMATTILGAGDVRIATTGALGVGTKTLDGQAFGVVAGQVGTAISTIIPWTRLWYREDDSEYPLVLSNQEGFVIRAVEVPATGVWKLAVQIDWEEVDPAAIPGWS